MTDIRVIDTNAAARIVGCSPRTLQRWRTAKFLANGKFRGPPWIHASPSGDPHSAGVYYPIGELMKWVAARNQKYEGEIMARLKIPGLLSKEEILARAEVQLGPRCGIYFLIKAGRIIYVGQSINVKARIVQHAQSKRFDSVAVIDCVAAQLDCLERAYITTLLPPLNKDYITRLTKCAVATEMNRRVDAEPAASQ